MTFTLGIPIHGNCGQCGAELPDLILESKDAQHFKQKDGTYSYSGMCHECMHKAVRNNGHLEPQHG